MPNDQLLRANDLLEFTRVLTHYENSLANASGEKFNIFNILGVGTLEAHTHTPLLAELLSPKGSHGQGALFLRLFIETLNLKPFNFDAATVLREHHIGARTEATGGRMDILIREGHTPRLLIENKIYAADQPQQLLRYQAFAPLATLVYLTLNGEEPDETQNLPNLVCLSYRTHIIRWLEACRKEACSLPGVRETITHYIHLIKQLTHQNSSSRMNDEIVTKVLGDRGTFAAFVAIRDSHDAVRRAIVQKLNREIEVYATKAGMSVSTLLEENGRRYAGLWFTHPHLSQHGVSIGFEFQGGDFRGLVFGFGYTPEGTQPEFVSALREEFVSQFGKYEQSKGWPAWTWYLEHRNWSEETFAEIQFGSFANVLGDRLALLKNVGLSAVKKTENRILGPESSIRGA